jgi:hypothetical protein
VEVRIGAPIRFALHGAYPNPSNGVATIPFEVARATPVRMDVYDMLGRQVAVLVDEEHAPGRYQVPLDVRRLSAGVYLYRIRMGDFQATRKLTVMR